VAANFTEYIILIVIIALFVWGCISVRLILSLLRKTVAYKDDNELLSFEFGELRKIYYNMLNGGENKNDNT